MAADHRGYRRGRKRLRAGRVVAHGRPRHPPRQRDRASWTSWTTRWCASLSDLARTMPVVGPIAAGSQQHGAACGRRPRSRPRSSQQLQVIPDVRAFKLNDRGERDIQLLDPVDERGRPERRGGPARRRAARRADCWPTSARKAPCPARKSRSRPRREEAARLGVTRQQIADGRAGGHHRRRRRRAWQAVDRQPADPGAGAA